MSDTAVGETGVRIVGINQREAWLAGELPPVEMIRPGIWSLPVEFPNNPLRYTLCYLLEDSRGPVLIDPGCLSEQEGIGPLVNAVRAAGYELSDIAGAVITHAHFDHHGLSGEVLKAAPNAWIGMHPDERGLLPSHFPADGSRGGFMDLDWMRARGVPEEDRESALVPFRGMELLRQMPEPTLLLEDGDVLPLADRQIRAVWTPGHTSGHLCYHDAEAKLFFSGDHVLPRISPNIGVQAPDAPPPLERYLSSLADTARFDECEVLPGHEWRFRGLAARTAELIEHHGHRCAEIVEAVEANPGADAWTVSSHITWSRGWDSLSGMLRRMALSETLAHLEYLEQRSRIRETTESGVVHYWGV